VWFFIACIFNVRQTGSYPSNNLFSRTTWVSWHQKGKTSLDFNEARDDGMEVASAGLYANQLHGSRQTTMPAPRHSIFYRPDAVPDAQPVVSKY